MSDTTNHYDARQQEGGASSPLRDIISDLVYEDGKWKKLYCLPLPYHLGSLLFRINFFVILAT